MEGFSCTVLKDMSLLDNACFAPRRNMEHFPQPIVHSLYKYMIGITLIFTIISTGGFQFCCSPSPSKSEAGICNKIYLNIPEDENINLS